MLAECAPHVLRGFMILEELNTSVYQAKERWLAELPHDSRCRYVSLHQVWHGTAVIMMQDIIPLVFEDNLSSCTPHKGGAEG